MRRKMRRRQRKIFENVRAVIVTVYKKLTTEEHCVLQILYNNIRSVCS